MIVEYLRYRVPPGGEDEFQAAYARAAVHLGRAEQCVDYELARSVDEPQCFVLRIVWTGAEEHMKGFRGGPHFGPFFEEVRPYLQDIEEMRHYEATGVRWSRGEPGR